MKRLHWIEITDQKWCPSILRDAVTQFLQLSINRGKYYRPIIDRLKRALAESHSERIIDICSGSGGPWISMQNEIRNGSTPVEIVLTDLYPRDKNGIPVSSGNLRFLNEPVNGTSVPPDLKGFRTLFTSFHHFRPEEAKSILEDAVKSKQGIAIFEMTERKLSVLARVLITTPLITLFLVPFIRPFRFGYFVWTYIIPVIPFILAHDGAISCFRTYTVEDLREMTAETGEKYRWDIGIEQAQNKHDPFRVTYCIGLPSPQVDSPQ